MREESGLHGARELNPADLGGAVMCINVDGQLASDLIIGAVGQENWEVEIKGKASHAGVAPEKGISATMVGAIALAEAQQAGWFGKVVKPDGRGTSNVGIFGGKDGKPAGDATNVVTDYAFIKGEARSPEAAFATKIADGYEEAFAKAQGRGEGPRGRHRRGDVQPQAGLPAVQAGRGHARSCSAPPRRSKLLGIEPTYLFSNGGLDANWLDKHGVPTDHHRRRPGRDPHHQGICEPRRVREGLPPRRAHGDARGLAVHAAAAASDSVRGRSARSRPMSGESEQGRVRS